jgi:SAM-dependent methyltransferase
MSPNFQRRYFSGDGLDIGGKPDPLSLYIELFPLLKNVRTWDLEDGDAQFLESVADNSYDFVHSSHCLEHLHDPGEGLANWFRVIRPGGFLIVTVPDEDLYEQGMFPSTNNKDHKWTFTIYKEHSWSSRSINLLALVTGLGEAAEIEKIELLNAGYRYKLPRYDQTLTPIGECAIELVIRKRTADEISSKGRKYADSQPGTEMRIHLNQYRDDLKTLKANNEGQPPFTNEADL